MQTSGTKTNYAITLKIYQGDKNTYMHLSHTLFKELEGDNCKIVIVNTEGEPKYIILPFHEYASLKSKREKERIQNVAHLAHNHTKGLTSDKLLDKINRNIAQWKETQNPMIELDNSYVLEDEGENLLYLESVDALNE